MLVDHGEQSARVVAEESPKSVVVDIEERAVGESDQRVCVDAAVHDCVNVTGRWRSDSGELIDYVTKIKNGDSPDKCPATKDGKLS